MYGKCVVTDYNSVHKDKCAKEFMKLKDCYLVWILTPFSPSVQADKHHLTHLARPLQREEGNGIG